MAIYDPSPVQQEFHLCDADEALFAGSAGPGKSLALLMDPIQTQLHVEHARYERGEIAQSLGWAIHFRRQFPMLLQTMERAHRLFPRIDPKVHWNGDNKIFTFSCGYKYQFGHLNEANDWQNYDSSEYTHVAFDELIQFEQEQYERLATRCRSSDPVLRKLVRIRACTNPSGNWVRRYFVDPAPGGRVKIATRIRMDDGGDDIVKTRVYIPATLKDNPDPGFRRDYEAQLKDRPAHIRLALLNGDWYVVAGAFFAEEWIPTVHVVEPFKVPGAWERFRSMDWGYKAPGQIGYYADDKDGNRVKYRELRFQNMDAGQVAAMVRKVEEEAGEWDFKRECSRLTGPADTQIWEKRGTLGPTIAETMMDAGVFWQHCTKNRLASTHELMRRLKDRTGEDKVPGFRAFKTCTQTIRAIPSCETDPNNRELPLDGLDAHAIDETLYAMMYRAPETTRDELPHGRDYYDDLEKARRDQHRRQRKGGKFGYGGH